MVEYIDIPRLATFADDLERCDRLIDRMLREESDVEELGRLADLATKLGTEFEDLGPSVDLTEDQIKGHVTMLLCIVSMCVRRISDVKTERVEK